MKIAPLTAIALLLALALGARAAQRTDSQRAEQEELLAWVNTLRYQARIEQATAVCETILASDPDCVDAWIEHGVLALSEERLEQAQEDFREALKRRRGDPMALLGRARVTRAQGDEDRAMRDARKALARCPHLIDAEKADADTWYQRGLAKVLLEDDTALQDFVMAVSLDPGHMDAHTQRAQIYRGQGRTQDAIDQLTKAVRTRPDYAVGYLARARLHYEAGDLDASIADCNRALEINPHCARAWHNRGLVSLQRGDLEAAISDLSEAIAADPDYASAHVYRGQAYLAFGNEAAARADWECAKELEPDAWAGETAAKLLGELQQTPADAE